MHEVRERVAREVVDAVMDLDSDDLNGRAGRHSWGYVEPTEAAWDLLEEAVEPAVEKMEGALRAGEEAEGRVVLEGILVGLYRLKGVDRHDVLDWAPDFPAEQAGWALDRWTGPAVTREFVQEFVPEWEWIGRYSQE